MTCCRGGGAAADVLPCFQMAYVVDTKEDGRWMEKRWTRALWAEQRSYLYGAEESDSTTVGLCRGEGQDEGQDEGHLCEAEPPDDTIHPRLRHPVPRHLPPPLHSSAAQLASLALPHSRAVVHSTDAPGLSTGRGRGSCRCLLLASQLTPHGGVERTGGAHSHNAVSICSNHLRFIAWISHSLC